MTPYYYFTILWLPNLLTSSILPDLVQTLQHFHFSMWRGDRRCLPLVMTTVEDLVSPCIAERVDGGGGGSFITNNPLSYPVQVSLKFPATKS